MSEKLAGSAVCDLCLLVTGVVTDSFFQFDIFKKIINLLKRANKSSFIGKNDVLFGSSQQLPCLGL